MKSEDEEMIVLYALFWYKMESIGKKGWPLWLIIYIILAQSPQSPNPNPVMN